MVDVAEVQVVSGGSAGTKGSWTEVIASTSEDSNLLVVSSRHQQDSNARRVVDIGVGAAASETVIVPDVLVDTVWLTPGVSVPIPIDVPAGSRISARSAANGASQTGVVSVAASNIDGIPVAENLTAYGKTNGYEGTNIDPGGTINTKGSWNELAASTGHQIDALWMAFGARDNSSMQDYAFLFDIGVGAAASETVIVGDVPNRSRTNAPLGYQILGPFGVDIAPGSRLAVRAECNGNDATDRVLGVMLYGAELSPGSGVALQPGIVL